MKQSLVQKKCVPCEGGMQPMGAVDIQKFQSQIDPDWEVVDQKSLRRRFEFKNFMAAISFLNHVADIAEQEGHHPDLHLTEYRYLTVELSTHSIGGLSENDFILAAKIEQSHS